jgi:hypothetical protein
VIECQINSNRWLEVRYTTRFWGCGQGQQLPKIEWGESLNVPQYYRKDEVARALAAFPACEPATPHPCPSMLSKRRFEGWDFVLGTGIEFLLASVVLIAFMSNWRREC